MKRTLLFLSLLLTVSLLNAQTDNYGDFAYGFGMAYGAFYSQPGIAGSYSTSEGVMQAQLIRVDMELAGCQNDSLAVSPAHVKDSTGFFLAYAGEDMVFRGEVINVFPAGRYDSTSYDAGHYNWDAQYNYDSLTTLVLDVWPIYELFDTLYLDSTEIVTDYAHNVLLIPAAIDQPLHGGPNMYELATADHNCDSIRHFFVNLCGGMVKDADGNEYASVYAGAPVPYCWTKSNMKTTHYADGSETPSMIYHGEGHEDEALNLETYGRLYNWYAAVNVPVGSDPAKTINGNFVTGICPIGWHIPDSANMESLYGVDALDLRSDILWLVPGHDTGAGFYALPAGQYNHSTARFEEMLGATYFWSSLRRGKSKSWVFSQVFGCEKFITDEMTALNGFSVRCVKNQMYADDGSELND